MMTTKRTFTVLGRILLSTAFIILFLFSIELLASIGEEQHFLIIDKLTEQLGEMFIAFFLIFLAFFMTNEWLRSKNKLHKPFPYFLYTIGVPIIVTMPISFVVFYLRTSTLDFTKFFHADTIIVSGILVFFWALVHYLKYNYKAKGYEKKKTIKNSSTLYKKVFLYALGMAALYSIIMIPHNLKLGGFIQTVSIEFIFSIIIAFFCWFLVSFFNNLYKEKTSFLSSLLVTTFGTFIIMKFILPILSFVLLLFRFEYHIAVQYFDIKVEFLSIGANGIFVIFCALIYQILYFQQTYSVEKKAFKSEIGKQTEKYESLRRQLSPHFLFNNINVLTALIEENPQKATRFSESLGNIYRHFLRQEDEDVVSLQSALTFSKDYLELLKYRYEEAFQYTLPHKVDSNYFIIPLALQQVIENTIKHNEVSSEAPLQVSIEVKDDYLIIQNTKQLKTLSEKTKATGIENIKTRYAFLTEQKVSVEDSVNSFTIKLPLLYMENA